MLSSIRLAACCLAAFASLLLGQAYAQNAVWRGTGPFCNGKCLAGETEINRASTVANDHGPRFGSACATGTKALCQSTPGRSCRWDGTAPFCHGSCRRGEVRASAPPGSSSGRSCATGHKVYCCRA